VLEQTLLMHLSELQSFEAEKMGLQVKVKKIEETIPSAFPPSPKMGLKK
jgi:hypothetical protein